MTCGEEWELEGTGSRAPESGTVNRKGEEPRNIVAPATDSQIPTTLASLQKAKGRGKSLQAWPSSNGPSIHWQRLIFSIFLSHFPQSRKKGGELIFRLRTIAEGIHDRSQTKNNRTTVCERMGVEGKIER